MPFLMKLLLSSSDMKIGQLSFYCVSQYIENKEMEESVKCMLLGQETAIPMDAIVNLNILITLQTLKEIRLPLSLAKFTPEITVLHSCIYYLIAVQKNLELSHSLSFRERCLSSLSEYYIKHKMNFELYQYGYLCGKILSIPLDRAMHIIYFLVYTRLASKPFINNIILQMQKMKRSQSKKKITMMLRSEKEFSLQSKLHQSRHMTIFYDSNQMETDILKKQLHKIMCPNEKQSKKVTKKMENKRYFNLRKVYPDDIDLKEQQQREREQYKSANTSRIATVPVKVSGNDNSSVIARLKLKSNVNKECSFKKIQVRRQKFNEWFDSAEKYEQIMSECDTKENRKPEWGTSKHIIDKDPKNVFAAGYKSSKHPFEYYQDIASNIRNKNEQLDSIRHQCFHHNQINLPNCLRQATSYRHFERGSLLTKHTMKTQSCKIDPIPENTKRIQTNREVVFQNYEKEKDYSKISKTASVSKFGENSLQDNLGSILTRKQDVVISEDEGLMLFNKKVKNKLKLQKYKQEYRHFMKTQVFDRVSKEVQVN